MLKVHWVQLQTKCVTKAMNTLQLRSNLCVVVNLKLLLVVRKY